MKINIGLELDDDQRDVLADWLDNKTSKRMATRKDVVGLVDSLLMGIIDSHAVIGQVDVTTQDPTIAIEECQECGGLGCDICEKGVRVVAAPRGPSWESHPRLAQFATQIEAGLEAHGYAGTYQERSYRRGWTLETIGANQ